ncbi:hypothetical protein [Pseudonocardia nigra]|uniref:hypothetical protein n=1 Tax=Pseudonocardia nigra TaxID=1921578 RepID=UPI001C5FE932|nr:hypothetical protein [Pseudonocardia nigra]
MNWTGLNLRITELVAWLQQRLEPADERGGGRNTDEGFHISGGAIVAGAIAAGVGAFVAKKLGALD